MNKLIFSIIAIVTTFQAQAQQKYFQQKVSYKIDVTLNDADRSLDGFIQIQYTNNSPDTLPFIWIHCWPNAYKNDRTAFSEQLLTNNRTDFYFSSKEQKGYINRLDFRVDDKEARMEDHPQYIDIIKVILPTPLAPNSQATLTTPFHVKLPYNFSRSGYTNDGFQLTQWYPKPAVYDTKGWHPYPYLDQGEFYSEFGDFDVRITVPGNYTVAATGQLQDAPTSQEIAPATAFILPPPTPKPKRFPAKPPPHKPTQQKSKTQQSQQIAAAATPKPTAAPTKPQPASPQKISPKTLHYTQKNIHDFAWFTSKHFKTLHDTLQLPSGRIIDVYSYYTPNADKAWKNSISFIKDAVRFRSNAIGEYPYQTVTAVYTKMGSTGGMEYPTITAINEDGSSAQNLDMTIEHEVGHNWFYGILASDERRYPWMDEGINTYYDNRYAALKYPPGKKDWYQNKFPDDGAEWIISSLEATHRDQPISSPSDAFTETNYNYIAYEKTGQWMKKLERDLGIRTFDSCMQEYYRRWAFKHPYPEDLETTFAETSSRNETVGKDFTLLDRTGPLTPATHKKLKPTFLFNINHTDQYRYLNFLPAVAYNDYDKFMIGILIHNYNLPPDHLQFYLAPLYATGSRQMNGVGGINYTWYPKQNIHKIDLGITSERFSSISGIDSNGKKITGGYYKLAPRLRLTFPGPDPLSKRETFIEWKTYLIGEKELDHYVKKTTDSLYYPTEGQYKFRYLNQLSLGIKDERALYPYSSQLVFQQAASFYRIDWTGNYFFNYEKGGGLDLRLFGSKFGYIGGRSSTEDLSRFMPKLTAVRGEEDYTYSNYFVGRNAFTGGKSQQIMMRDGNLKLRTDLFQGLQGRSDDWVAALNLNTSLPRQIVPEWLPLSVFFDVGTYAGAWQNNPPTSHFLYVGGLQLSLFKNIVRVYAPLIYSKDFRDQLKTVPDQNTFWKKISFSIDLQNIDFRKLFGNIPL